MNKFVYSIIKSESDAEDLVHEVFVKVWENSQRSDICLKVHGAQYMSSHFGKHFGTILH
ncbi:sigma factor [Mangrovibacterium marinum]|uniref:RNA polymerase sigma factor n=1 Tax=Mangrovibacterium marinum TaxID=1639118 RepID=UPI000D31371A